MGESGANLEHSFRGREITRSGAAKWGQGPLQDSGDVERSSELLGSVRVSCLLKITIVRPDLRARSTWSRVSRALLPQARIVGGPRPRPGCRPGRRRRLTASWARSR